MAQAGVHLCSVLRLDQGTLIGQLIYGNITSRSITNSILIKLKKAKNSAVYFTPSLERVCMSTTSKQQQTKTRTEKKSRKMKGPDTVNLEILPDCPCKNCAFNQIFYEGFSDVYMRMYLF